MALVEVPFDHIHGDFDVSVNGCGCQVGPPSEVPGLDDFDPGGFWWEVNASIVESDELSKGRVIVDILGDEGICRMVG